MRFPIRQKKQIAATVLILFIVLYNTTALGSAFSFARKPISALGGILYGASSPVQNFFSALTKANAWAIQIKTQQEQIAGLTFKLNELSSSESFAVQHSFEQFSSMFGATIIEARVVSSQVSAGKKIVILNKGADDGISPGQAVITSQAVFLGKVISAQKDFSAALVITDSSSTIASMLSNQPNIQAIVKGKQGIGLEMDLIPQDADIEIGNVIVTSLLEENTPQGLLIGAIASIKYTEGELFKRAALQPFFSLQNLSKVGVIIPPSIE